MNDAQAALPPPLLQEKTGGVLRLTLNRPEQ
jgi:hypothetical protein